MDPRDFPCSVCWQHAEEWCSLCDPDPEEELRMVQELADRMFEKGGFDFTTASPPAGCERGTESPGRCTDSHRGQDAAPLIERRPSCQTSPR